ncbi:amidase family protein [Aneurinibacillus tyrosinisolvens]|uniref:amidase family protein n=1 Tax=Aneurinibacillus tyrosinisolvens TaxID=1443435 RepID=UPI00137935F2
MPYPATKNDPTFEEGDIDASLRTIPFNISGHPALTISAGNTTDSNLPVGIQMIARYDDEAAIYRVADVYERETGGFRRPPL